MRKLSNRVISCLLCLICMLPLSPVQVFAAGAIDVNKAVHLKIQYIHDKTPVSDVPFDLYYVASVDAYGEFTLAGDFQKYPVVVSGLSTDAWRTLAETLAVYADSSSRWTVGKQTRREISPSRINSRASSRGCIWPWGENL